MLENKLNPQQVEAVRYLGGPLLVLAGAGSGKTRVITHKISYLLKECQIPPYQILAVTFTNKAAREMAERVRETCGSKETRGLKVSTFHNFGFQLIQKEHEAIGMKPNMTIFDTEDSLNLLGELAGKDASATEQLNAHLNLISSWKNRGLLPDETLSIAKDEFEQATARLYEAYQKQLTIYNAVDFDDLILKPTILLKTNDALREKWQNRIKYLLVDEYQDTNVAQYQLIRLLTGPRAAFTVVGDDHQSVYAWRGANVENLLTLQTDYPHLKIVKLLQNYRSTTRILNVANKLISFNDNLFDKDLFSQNGLGDEIRILRANDDAEEAGRICSEILTEKFQHQRPFSDFSILYRSNHQARLFEKSLREHQIPYIVSGSVSFFSRAEVKDILAYLRVMVNPDDDCAFLRIVNTPRRELGPATIEKLSLYAKNREMSLFAASFELGLTQTLSGKPLERLQTFTRWLTETADNAKRGDTIGVIQEMLKTIQYETWLLDTCSHPKTAERRMEYVQELVSWLKKMVEPEDDTPPLSLDEAVNKMLLIDIMDKQNQEAATNCVSLMTLHAAKGLEFPVVYMAGLEEEILPHRNSIDADTIEEERRLAYVGVTRAQEKLTVTYCTHRKKYGDTIECIPSRFLEEMNNEDVVWEGHEDTPQTQEQKQAKGRDHLAAIRGMLNTT